ncbi:hypothetical protein GCM10017744_082980 [Streptomyces antimycoticus]
MQVSGDLGVRHIVGPDVPTLLDELPEGHRESVALNGLQWHERTGRDHGGSPVREPPCHIQFRLLAACLGIEVHVARQDGGNPRHDRCGRKVDDHGEQVMEHLGIGHGESEITRCSDNRVDRGGGAAGDVLWTHMSAE